MCLYLYLYLNLYLYLSPSPGPVLGVGWKGKHRFCLIRYGSHEMIATAILLPGISCVLYATHRESKRWILYGASLAWFFRTLLILNDKRKATLVAIKAQLWWYRGGGPDWNRHFRTSQNVSTRSPFSMPLWIQFKKKRKLFSCKMP